MLVFAAMASLVVSLSAVSLRSTTPSPGENVASTPAEIVASRFPFADAALPVQPAAFSTASVMPVERWERFDQDALSGVATPGVATSEPPWPTAAEGRPAAIETTEPPISGSTGRSCRDGEIAPPKRRPQVRLRAGSQPFEQRAQRCADRQPQAAIEAHGRTGADVAGSRGRVAQDRVHQECHEPANRRRAIRAVPHGLIDPSSARYGSSNPPPSR